ncbi:uracil-DNA glycosylase [Candidatus Profftia sp. (ex Adelges kitamiensis)]|uniref:uracil-DNA glycosylase n=1 Tax=Candidatus Profftia sp. (ex Adelges kitamiensis) TaxID=2864218 RepID=UPI001CE2A00D|nr:uracil-DNA glycosylase [Candidatus Profftia sp. (ex Adelges kitamiensis)]
MTLPLNWHDVIGIEKKQYYFNKILNFVTLERQSGKIIYPLQKDIFNAFRFTAFHDVKVVILGQDPYHGLNQAHGLSFSVLPGTPVPASLINIYKELYNDIEGFKIPKHGYLKSWADQGVLLLNTILTVECGKPYSHAKLGWETFTNKVLLSLNEYRSGIIFLLWGVQAQKKSNIINSHLHQILQTSHPSPMSAYRGFLGCHHFSQTNHFLLEQNKKPINWQPFLPEK